jgi:hypothetical protein
MQLDLTSKRAKKLIGEYDLTEEEVQQLIASARINLATFDAEYRANVTQIADELHKSRPTLYGWADRALEATIYSLRNIRTGRPPKDRAQTDRHKSTMAPEEDASGQGTAHSGGS